MFASRGSASLLALRLALTLTLAVYALLLGNGGCGDDQFATAYRIEQMAQVIGGPAAAARPGDYMLENEQIRAVVHGRPNQRSTMPVSNGSLMDLDLQRPRHAYSDGKGRDAFYELGPMVNLKVSAASQIDHGICEMRDSDTPSVGVAPCPGARCARVSVAGGGDNVIGMLSLLDLAISRNFKAEKLQILTDYDLCPGDSFLRVTTTARFERPGEPIEMDDLLQQTGLLDVLLGETTGQVCTKDAQCGPGAKCAQLLVEITFGGLNVQMRRCRRPDQKIAGVLAGDFILFSGKSSVFIPGSGFDQESYIRSLFDAGGDVFSAPLSRSFVAAVAPEVSYAYFNGGGEVMIPVFAEAFTASMTNRFACRGDQPSCLDGKELRYTRYVSVGKGDVASALEGFYKVRGIKTGRVEGHVIDLRTSKPITDIDVFAFAVPKAWEGRDAAALGAASLDELMREHQAESRGPGNPDGEPGLVSQFRTDIGLYDRIPDGSFAGSLPVGRYLLVARRQGLPPSRLVPIDVAEGKTTGTALLCGQAVHLQYQIQDRSGRALPSKLTIGHCFPECARDEDCGNDRPVCDPGGSRLCIPAGGYTDASSCRPDQIWGADPFSGQETCVCPTTGRLPLALGGTRYADGTVRTVLAETGQGAVDLEPSPAAYQVIVSRGFEYEIHKSFIPAVAGTTQRLQASLPRVVDTTGWISADFHVHGPNSVDSGLDHETRVRSYVAEGVELLTATDHDHITDFGPTIRKLGLDYWIKSQSGLEVSPLDYGHFIGFPLRFDQNLELNGAFHWRVPAAGGGWDNMKPGDIFSKLRELGSLGPDKTAVFIAHFYDNFTFYDLDPWTMEPPVLNVSAVFNPVLGKMNFSGEFDALEAFNGKNLDVIRRPTYQEVQDYNTKLAAFLADPAVKELPYEERQRRWAELSAAAQREFLRRTPEEQETAIDFGNPSFSCRCSMDSECGPQWLCDTVTAACVPGCTDDSACDPERLASGREKCLPAPGGGPDRRTCQRVGASCTNDTDCQKWGTASEACIALDASQPAAKTCELRCTADSGCRADPMRPLCDLARQVCGPTSLRPGKPTDPCPTLRGTIDDWFQLLNHGVRRPILGDSDSHSVYSIEAGIPRTYVRLGSDMPQAVDIEAVAGAVKASQVMPSYGPFIEMTLNDEPIGSVVPLPSGGGRVRLHLRVQSPTWFDVDRLEVYRNGELIRVIEGKVGCAEGSNDCIPVPNRQVLDFDGFVDDAVTADAWYVAVVMGLDGKSLAPVYSSTPVARLGMYELIQRLTPLLPPLRSFRTPLSPSMGIVRPFAATSPIWVDVGGDGLKPLKPLPSWAAKRDRPPSSSSAASALTQSEPAPPEHDHRPGLGRMRQQAAAVQIHGLSVDAIRQALDSLKYIGR